MSEPDVPKALEKNELSGTQVEDIAGGGLIDGQTLIDFSASLIQTYDNLVAFASHVIGRVAGEP
ncbi:MAG TPA: hypothetical protein VFV55_03425 [Usitatibacteraceae bacterium]|nr:hypothetical protein [Usitatibacteraceae bacterium]